MWIDFGCGGSPRGDVNVDQYYDESPHTNQKINPKKIKNFIIGSAEYPPIRDKSVHGVSGYHLIEHTFVPTTCLNAMKQVAQKYMVICVPNHPLISESHKHYYSWSKRSLETLLGEYGEVVYSKTRLMWWNSNRVLKAVSRLPFLALRRLAYHLLNLLFGTEILVVVDVSEGMDQGD